MTEQETLVQALPGEATPDVETLDFVVSRGYRLAAQLLAASAKLENVAREVERDVVQTNASLGSRGIPAT